MATGMRPCLSQRRLLIRPRGTWCALLLLLGSQCPLFGEPPPSTFPLTPLPREAELSCTLSWTCQTLVFQISAASTCAHGHFLFWSLGTLKALSLVSRCWDSWGHRELAVFVEVALQSWWNWLRCLGLVVTARVPLAEPCGSIWAPGRLPPTKPQWHTDHFELRLLKKCPTNRGTHPSVSQQRK